MSQATMTDPISIVLPAKNEADNLERLLPDVPFAWIECKVGQMGIFALHHDDLVAHHAEIARLASQRP